MVFYFAGFGSRLIKSLRFRQKNQKRRLTANFYIPDKILSVSATPVHALCTLPVTKKCFVQSIDYVYTINAYGKTAAGIITPDSRQSILFLFLKIPYHAKRREYIAVVVKQRLVRPLVSAGTGVVYVRQ